MPSNTPFKRCPSCFHEWETRKAFIKDVTLDLNGYKSDFERLEYGLFFFTHKQKECFSTMAIEVVDFLDMYPNERHAQRRTGEEDCPGYCLDKNELDRCEAICECAFVREIMHQIRQHRTG